ncbi:MAG: hypothetical protein F2923_05840 [Actinobacteria bacterium]|uniref:Unannotated protein n=1 Tax=freshwater metagenome TaxID=449393 RepID=A0A6J7SHH2_9ZZZZ|nr:hypothetical protein [Actinomycetota bacterium]
MSATFSEASKALHDNAELSAKVMSAGSPAERAEILKAAGIPVPTHADVNAYHASLSDVSGAGNTNPSIPIAVGCSVAAASAN